ncbi:hypothetical protein J6590_090059 [Homalodisca vitripennis]|nr:hypothetical protein J6590_090059 [Homalodisca vitripennis]
MNGILDIGENVNFDDSVINIEWHSHNPYSSNSLKNSDEIRIPVHQQDVYTLPSRSFLLIEGKIIKVADNSDDITTELTIGPFPFLLLKRLSKSDSDSVSSLQEDESDEDDELEEDEEEEEDEELINAPSTFEEEEVLFFGWSTTASDLMDSLSESTVSTT